ncbi:MAG TPA: membrane protein insertion efficiency factor YidD [bacterium]|nr:membrane protein insertion efficiency factor YidD [bacterium]HPS30139.1 membrane protein insertion efficiency factor YidD [bacterium]
MKFLLIKLIRGYQIALSPYFGKSCRFYPTCSQYMIEAVDKKGVVKGIFLGLWRVLRCNPWNRNCGYDPVK